MLSFPRSFGSPEDDFLFFPLDYQKTRLTVPGPAKMGQAVVAHNRYNLNLDYHQFDPSEVTVKLDEDGTGMTICGKRVAKSEDATHYECREYVNRFTLPPEVDDEQMKVQLDQKGILRIEAPLKEQHKTDKGRNIPIEFVKK